MFSDHMSRRLELLIKVLKYNDKEIENHYWDD